MAKSSRHRLEGVSIVQTCVNTNLPNDLTIIYDATIVKRRDNDGIILFFGRKSAHRSTLLSRYSPNDSPLLSAGSLNHRYDNKAKFHSMLQFTRFFSVLDRRVIVEKTGYL